MLHFDQRWRLVAPGPISTEVQDEFYGLIMKVRRKEVAGKAS